MSKIVKLKFDVECNGQSMRNYGFQRITLP